MINENYNKWINEISQQIYCGIDPHTVSQYLAMETNKIYNGDL